jgi:predicted ATPase
MGLHTGELRRTGEGYAGRELHRAARIAASGHGGQIVVSAATRALVDGDLVELGEHRIKDFDQPVPIFQLGRERFPPLKTISNTNLPRPVSSFVGRRREREEILRLVRDGTRLTTLTGPGGSGKTRLAVEAASELVPEYKAGVFWVPLASLRDPALVAQTVAQTLGAKDGLAGHIGERELLLVLDNFEQVAAAAPDLSALLEGCPNLKLLVTSRELLRIRGEVEYPVPPLAEPEAVELFCSRSRVEPDETIAEICRRLDDLPLAVELAAARTRVLTPRQILDRLGGRLDLLKGGRDLDARQQTLRATIEWSYDLLDEAEKLLFARLAVFRGGCTLEATEAVCDADIDVLQSLVDKSLLRRTQDRYWMLETIRQLATEKFETQGDSAGIRAAHAEFIASLLERADPHLRGPDQQEWADRIALEFDNVRAAMEFGLGAVPEVALRIVAGLTFFATLRGRLAEIVRWVDAALDAAVSAPLPLRGWALVCGAVVSRYQGDVAAGARYLEAAVAMTSTANDEALARAVLRERGIVSSRLGDLPGARQLFEELAVVAERGADPWNAAVALNNLGDLALYDGDWARTIELCGRSSELRRGIGNVWGAALSQCNVALAQRELGLLDDAARSIRQALEDSLAVEVPMVVLACLQLGALLAGDRSRSEDAAALLGAQDQLQAELEVGPEEYEGALIDALRKRTRESLGDERYGRAYDRGRSLLVEDAAALVFSVTANP